MNKTLLGPERTQSIKENMNRNKKEQLYTGKYDSNSKGFGFVPVDGFARDVFIPKG